MSEPEAKRQRTEIPVEYRCTRTNSMVDISSTLRHVSGDTEPSLVRDFLKQLLGLRVSVFTLLEELGQPFNLDNWIALQEMVLLWLKMYNVRRKDAATVAVCLRTQQQFLWVWWEARSIRIWTWPPELKDALINFCRALLCKALQSEPSPCKHGYAQRAFKEKPPLLEINDICSMCAKSMLNDLRMDYKCLSFQHI